MTTPCRNGLGIAFPHSLSTGRKWSCAALIGLALLTQARAAEPEAIPSWLQENLAPNPGFEAVAADGHTPESWVIHQTPPNVGSAEVDSKIFLQGTRSLKLSLPSSRSMTVTSPPIPIEGGTPYFFSIGFRQEGFNIEGKELFEGVASSPGILWLDAGGKSVGHSSIISSFPYGPSPWNLRDAFEQAPTNARFARIEVVFGNDSQKQTGKDIPSTLWLDTVQFRHYLPPPTPDWAKGETPRMVEGAGESNPVLAYFQGSDEGEFSARGGGWSQMVIDPQAERGSALEARLNAKPGFMSLSPYFPALPPGLYRVRARVKVPATATDTLVGSVHINTLFAGTRLVLPILPDPQMAGKYRDVEGDFILRDAGWWNLLTWTEGKVPWTMDSLKVFPLALLQDRQLLALYPGSAAEIPADLKPVPFKRVVGGPRQPFQGLVVAGMGYDRLHLGAAFHLMHRDPRMTAVWAKMFMGVTTFSGFPDNPRDFFQYPIIFLCDISMRSLSLNDKNALLEYVKRGGALVVFGGHQGYGRGAWTGSLLAEAMPVIVTPSLEQDLIHFPQGEPLVMNAHVPWLNDFSGAPVPLAYYLHRVTLKPEAQVLIRAGGEPFCVAGQYGEGRVVCFLGIPWGDASSQGIPFWEKKDWPYLLREIFWWAVKSPDSEL